jgi:hypothetical protein
MKFISRLFRRRPVNDIGPFHFPSPDDPRWIRKVAEGYVTYELEGIHCHLGRTYQCPPRGGNIFINGSAMTDAEGKWDSWGHKEDRYVLAVDAAYNRSHPNQAPRDLRDNLKDQIIAYLDRIGD